MCVVGTQFRIAVLPVSSTILEYHSLRISLTVSSTITIQSVEYHNQSYMSVVTVTKKGKEEKCQRKCQGSRLLDSNKEVSLTKNRVR
jgi:hypothetical protein